jgi:hypothetical protein
MYVMAAYQILLWAVLIYLHIALQHEEVSWRECVGKIRSAYLRKIHGEEELNELRVHNYSPLVNKLIALNFAQCNSSVAERSLLLRWKIKDELSPYFTYWYYLIIAFLVAVWFTLNLIIHVGLESLKLTIYDPRSLLLWFMYAIILVRKQIFIWIGLGRIEQSLLLPQYD